MPRRPISKSIAALEMIPEGIKESEDGALLTYGSKHNNLLLKSMQEEEDAGKV
ncbi:uncharacterized protein G2W53_037866 [Senna tora]|uniref:Uncharacterized protein n=1 Tax=Senna tora TaxID=362788 RepID=A0A834SJY3_9FABA|nr:uncharacterized protein G2W53_037866 [Senna tora]